MNASEYIISQLENLLQHITNIRVRYEHDKNACVHIVEIVPDEVYHLNNEYMEWELEMFDKFISLYPTENICFISDDDLVGIKNVMYIKEGLTFAQFSEINDINICMPSITIKQNSNNIEDFNFYSHEQCFDAFEKEIKGHRIPKMDKNILHAA